MPTYSWEGVEDLQRLLKGTPKEINKQLRVEAKRDAKTIMLPALHTAANSSATPQARAAMKSARPKSDRFAALTIGGGKKVTSRGTPAKDILFGSEYGGPTFTAARGGNYWLEPAIESFTPRIEDAMTKRVYKVVSGLWDG